MAATHILESRGYSADLKEREALQPLTPWRVKNRCHEHAYNPTKIRQSLTYWREPRMYAVSRPEAQQSTIATHILKGQGQDVNRHCEQAWQVASDSSYSHPGEPMTGMISSLRQKNAQQLLTFWRANDRHDQQPETEKCTTATHILESQWEAWSAGLKQNEAQQLLTS